MHLSHLGKPEMGRGGGFGSKTAPELYSGRQQGQGQAPAFLEVKGKSYFLQTTLRHPGIKIA